MKMKMKMEMKMKMKRRERDKRMRFLMDKHLIEEEFVADVAKDVRIDRKEGSEGKVRLTVAAVEAVRMVMQIRIRRLHHVHKNGLVASVAILAVVRGRAGGRAVRHAIEGEEASCGEGIRAARAEEALEVKVLVACADDGRFDDLVALGALDDFVFLSCCGVHAAASVVASVVAAAVVVQ